MIRAYISAITKAYTRAVIPGNGGGNNADNYWYGIEIDEANSSPDVKRIASDMTLHNAITGLPCHKNIKGCLLADAGTVNYYLNPTDWSKKADGTASARDGSNGQVMMEWGDFYYKVENNYPSAGKHQIKISPFSGNGWVLVPKHYISAYEAGIQRSTLKLASVINTSTDYRGGNNNPAYDALSSSLLGKPASNFIRTNFRTYARSRGAGWNINSYSDYKWLFWFYVIEYATLNSQKDVNTDLTVDGYRQGGLGAGVTTAVAAEWDTFSAYNPFINCGATDSLANLSGEVSVTVTDFGGAGENRTFAVPRYRGHENPFGHIWNILDGVNINIKSVAEGDVTETWISDDPATWNDANYTGYANIGNQARANGYQKTALMGSGAEFVPAVTGGGADQTHYYCDYYYTNIPASGVSLRMLMVCGSGNEGVFAGLAYSHSYHVPSHLHPSIGSRLLYKN